jgi:hypothetical protein
MQQLAIKEGPRGKILVGPMAWYDFLLLGKVIEHPTPLVSQLMQV